jgi:hypothetical protein
MTSLAGYPGRDTVLPFQIYPLNAHILIEPCHSNHGEDACQELLKEISFIVYVIKEKETRKITVNDGIHHTGKT